MVSCRGKGLEIIILGGGSIVLITEGFSGPGDLNRIKEFTFEECGNNVLDRGGENWEEYTDRHVERAGPESNCIGVKNGLQIRISMLECMF